MEVVEAGAGEYTLHRPFRTAERGVRVGPASFAANESAGWESDIDWDQMPALEVAGQARSKGEMLGGGMEVRRNPLRSHPLLWM